MPPSFLLVSLAALGQAALPPSDAPSPPERAPAAATLSSVLVALQPAPASEAPRVEFNREIRPILADNCYACHGPDRNQRKAELRLDMQEDLARVVGNIEAVRAGRLEESELLRRVLSEDPQQRMPPPESQKQLTPAQIELLRRWIEQGAAWQGHWAYLPITRPAIPPVADPQLVYNPIDAFVLAALAQQGLSPAPEADRATLARRASLDLRGLPPDPAELEAFLQDGSAEAYEKYIDRMLASPHYGERMAMFWLDLVRYADSVGFHGDQAINMFAYRDYVIDAFNHNLPFDQFTLEQLAGDLLPEASASQKIASAYNRLNMMSAEGGGQDKEYLAKYAADRVRATSGAWLGATFGCAECHDHKYDPYTTRDFYRFEAFFADVTERGIYHGANDNGQWGPMMPTPTRQQAAELARLDAEISQLQAQLSAGAQDPEALRQRLAELDQARAALAAQVVQMPATVACEPRPIRILPRGNWMDDSGEIVLPGVPEFLQFEPEPAHRQTRVDLARWLTSPHNPLTARVFVNRLWKLCFGAGLSRRSDDLGTQGEPPSHPELLDWLASEFIDSGWNVKHVLRLIVTSRTYRQSSQADRAARERDPYNRWLARQGRFRVEAELVRDIALAASGLLVREVGGPSVKPYQPPGYWAYLNFPPREWQNSSGKDLYRRGLYTHWQRQYLHPALLAFDAPSREECTAERVRSNTPLQALVLLNDTEFVEAARALAARMLREAGASAAERIGLAYRLVLSRPPRPHEVEVLSGLADRHLAEYRQDPAAAAALLSVGAHPVAGDLDPCELAAWTSVARVLLNLHETITRS
jgi:mono/diheme cytochrome c family protein